MVANETDKAVKRGVKDLIDEVQKLRIQVEELRNKNERLKIRIRQFNSGKID